MSREYWDAEPENDASLVQESYTDDWLCAIVPHIAAGMMPGRRILDLGCGSGRLLDPIAKLAPQAELVGVDISPVHLREAWYRCNERPNVTLVLGDGYQVPDIGPLHAAYSVLLFQHLDPETVKLYLRSLHCWLVPGAPFRFQVVTAHGTEPEQTGEHAWNYPRHWFSEHATGWQQWPAAGSDLYAGWDWHTLVRR